MEGPAHHRGSSIRRDMQTARVELCYSDLQNKNSVNGGVGQDLFADHAFGPQRHPIQEAVSILRSIATEAISLTIF